MTLIIIFKVLLKKIYETSFISNILGNIYHEDRIGKFESCTYSKRKTRYLNDIFDLYNYASKYYGKFI